MKRLILILTVFYAAVCFSSDITWRKYKEIPTDITIGQGDILTIEAGTILRFGRNAKLTVKGEIKALGTAEEGIRFLPLNRLDPFWNGVKLDSASGLNEFSWCHFDFINRPGDGQGSFTNEASTAVFNNCVFKANSADSGGALKIIGGHTEIYSTDFVSNTAGSGGALSVTVTSVDSTASLVILSGCSFDNNRSTNEGGAVYISEPVFAEQVMNISITDCVLHDNSAFNGGAVFYTNNGGTSLTMKRDKFYSNYAQTGSAAYMKFIEADAANIPPQIFANLLIFKNFAEIHSALAIDVVNTLNPEIIDFTNATIGFNYSPAETCAGVFIRSNGIYPLVRNSIIWGNLAAEQRGNFFIQDGTATSGDIFKYCDIEKYLATDNNINGLPLFVRKPLNALPEKFDEERYDFHTSLLSPCVNSGDPLEPTTEPDNSSVNIGAYGNTIEATKGTYNTVFASVVSDLNIADGSVTVLDFQGKSGKFILDNIDVGRNSQLYLKSADNASISVNSLTSAIPVAGKFTSEYSKIQKLVTDSASADIVQSITVNRFVQLYNTDMSDINLKVKKDGILSPEVNMNDTKIFTTLATSDTGIVITDANIVNIQNSKILDYGCGISIQNSVKSSKLGTFGGISGNMINFGGSDSLKAGSQKKIGIEINNSNIDIEDNDIEDCDEGIVMKAGSSGRISNNTVSFDASESNKKGFIKKGVILSENSSSPELSYNSITNTDTVNTSEVIGIEVDNSFAQVFYNQLQYSGYSAGPRTGVNLIYPDEDTSVFNNTIYGVYTAFTNIPGIYKTDISNNIFWAADSTSATAVNDTTNLRFYNNCFLKGLPAGINGTGNFNIDPELNLPSEGDFTTASESPCINAGIVIDGIHTFADSKTVYYYGSAPDIGAEELWQELTAPSTVITSATSTEFTFSWDPVEGFDYYTIYSANDPYGIFLKVETVADLNYTVSVSDKEFYYVVATTDLPTKYYQEDMNIETAEITGLKKPVRPQPKKIGISKKSGR